MLWEKVSDRLKKDINNFQRQNNWSYQIEQLCHIYMYKINDKCLLKSVTMGFTIQFTMGNGQVDDT